MHERLEHDQNIITIEEVISIFDDFQTKAEPSWIDEHLDNVANGWRGTSLFRPEDHIRHEDIAGKEARKLEALEASETAAQKLGIENPELIPGLHWLARQVNHWKSEKTKLLEWFPDDPYRQEPMPVGEGPHLSGATYIDGLITIADLTGESFSAHVTMNGYETYLMIEPGMSAVEIIDIFPKSDS